jgi:hypothetical protein
MSIDEMCHANEATLGHMAVMGGRSHGLCMSRLYVETPPEMSFDVYIVASHKILIWHLYNVK